MPPIQRSTRRYRLPGTFGNYDYRVSALLDPIFQRGEETVFALQLERYFWNQGEIQDSPFPRSILSGEFMNFGDGIGHILELSDVEAGLGV